ncbi:MAG: hypothetical protein IPP78_00390 [Holophagaceae bacterium]|nr:hypothetical protein [Holophagaceae bacterium]
MRHVVFPFLLSAFLLSLPMQAGEEPDGSRSIGAVPPFHGEPAPPSWLRAASHAVALVDTRHYLYEVYGMADADDPRISQWIVRYVMLPEGNEAFRELEQVFLFDGNPKHKPKELKPDEINVEPKDATWKNAKYKLVDRRDLMLP